MVWSAQIWSDAETARNEAAAVAEAEVEENIQKQIIIIKNNL